MRSCSYELLAAAAGDNPKSGSKTPDGENFAKNNGDVPSTRFDVGFADTIGRRSSMEDTHLIQGSFCENPDNDLFLLFDGHNGRTAAEYAKKNLPETLEQLFIDATLSLSSPPSSSSAESDASVAHKLKKAFVTTHRAIIKKDVGGGTTAAAVLFLGNTGYVAHVGDSMVGVHTPGKGLHILTRPHRPTDPREAEMVRQRGGFILRFSAREVRVNGILAVTRALGDMELGTSISPEPDVAVIPFEWDDPPTIIVACDGLWDYMSEEDVAEIMERCPDPKSCAEELRNAAYQVGGSSDNISVMIIKAKKN